MKTYFALIALCFSAATIAAQNPNIEVSINQKCKIGGCKLVCTPTNGKVYVKADKIRKVTTTLFKSGTVAYYLKFDFEDATVTTPRGTESCILTNINS